VHACSLQPAGESHPRGELARSLKGAGKKKNAVRADGALPSGRGAELA
jgi:hypothetical protein